MQIWQLLGNVLLDHGFINWTRVHPLQFVDLQSDKFATNYFNTDFTASKTLFKYDLSTTLAGKLFLLFKYVFTCLLTPSRLDI